MRCLHRFFTFLFFVSSFLFFIPSITYSQSSSAESESSDWFYGKRIRNITFKGLSKLSDRDLEGVTSGFIGKEFSDDIFSDLYDKISALDYFEDINPEAIPGDSKKKTVGIIFNVKERPFIRKISIVGNKVIRYAELKNVISMKEKDIFVENDLANEERAIKAFYIEKGFSNVKVSSSKNESKKGVEVVFKIDEGKSIVISEVNFVGNKVASSRSLKGVLKLKKVGLFSKGSFQESMLESDRQSVQNFYFNKGYLDASVVDVSRDVVFNEKKNRDEISITFHIQEGNQYTYAGVSFVGNEIFSDDELKSNIKLKEGKIFDQSAWNEGFMKISDLYYKNGYTSNRFNTIPLKDSENKTIFYTLYINENARSHVENIIIKGNKKTKEEIILREIPLESGDLFSKSKVETGLRNLYNLQYFSAVVPDVTQGSEENLVNLVVSVEEQSTTSIELGVTFSGVSDPEDLPFALFAKWQDSNFRGSGKSLSLSTTLSTNEQSIDLGLSDNWLFGTSLFGSISTGFSHTNLSALRLHIDEDGICNTESYYMDYEQFRWNNGVTVGKRWTPDWAILTVVGGLNFTLKCNKYDSDLWIPVDTIVSRYANTWGWQNSVWTAFSIDDRIPNNYDPDSGWFASQRFTWYGLLPVEKEYFLRTDTKLEKYFTLLDWAVTEKWNLKLVLAGYTGFSMLFPAPNTAIGDSSKLYIDGMFNGRGWTDIYNKKEGKGKAMWSSNIELRFPVVPGILALDWFGDAVAVKNSPNDMISDLKVEDFFFSTGPGIRFTIPQFPLRLLFANTFKVVEDVEDGGKKIEWKDKWKFVLSFCMVNK